MLIEKEAVNLPNPVLRDLTWFIGRKICKLNSTRKNEDRVDQEGFEDAGLRYLISSGVRHSYYFKFQKAHLEIIARDTRSDSISEIAQKALGQNKNTFETELCQEDRLLKNLIREQKNEALDKICNAL